LFFAHFCY